MAPVKRSSRNAGMIIPLISALQGNRIFKFLASVRLAVPLMFVLLVACAAGTVYESRYNAEIATMFVYRSPWFLGLLGLLWVNIFCATIARVPFRKHHLGFVITHIGLLTLLIGGIMTATLGIDGQLRVIEGSRDNEVFLPGLVLRMSGKGAGESVRFPRKLAPLDGDALGWVNSRLAAPVIAEKYLPFVALERTFLPRPDRESIAIKFHLKSPFFQVSEWLDSAEKPELRMGPALLRIVTEKKKTEKKSALPQKKAKKPRGRMLRIRSARSNSVMAEVSLAELRKGPASVGPVRIALVRALERAAVGSGKLEEGDGPSNPALELRIEHEGKSIREIAFSRFPTFALHSEGAFGLRFEYLGDKGAASGAEEAASSPEPGDGEPGEPGPRGGNVIEFHVADLTGSPQTSPAVTVELLKNETRVLQKELKEREAVTTPWMGMVLTLEAVVRGGVETEEVRAIELPARSQLPPSAIRFRVPGTAADEGFWMVEGSSRRLPAELGGQELYYGMDSIRLPFSVHLNKFSKIDYPGTATAMSYQSEVQVDGQGERITVKMNEPLKRDGFTLYQSSYILQPGQPAVSIFSVNRDPGRWVKYFGALALSLGIVIFTVMRSSWYLRSRKKAAS